MKGRDEITPGCLIWPQERALLEGLTAILPEGARVVNIGAESGCSTVAILRGARDIRDFTLWSIDIEERPDEARYVAACGLAVPGRFYQKRGDSKVLAWEGWPPLNLVFIDGDHSYEGCKGDLEGWSRLVRKDGYLAVHDYEHRYDSVTKAVDEWFREGFERIRGWEWRKVARVDITVVFKRGQPDERIFNRYDSATGKFTRGEA